MNLRPLFHVSTATSQIKRERPRLPSAVDIEFESDEPEVRGRSFETWTRARGWASED